MGRPRIVDSIVERLLRRFAAGAWQPGATVPAGRRLAAEFGVSLMTIQAALRRIADYMLIEVRPRRPMVVLPGAKDAARRFLKSPPARREQRHLAILIPEVFLPPALKGQPPMPKNPFYRVMIHDITHEAASKQIRVTPVRWPVADQIEVAGSLSHLGYDAALFLGYLPDYAASLSMLHRRGFPIMVFNRKIRGLPLPAVITDDYHAGRRIAERLVHLGHRNLCLVASLDANPMAGAEYTGNLTRGRGWLDALRDAGVISQCALPIYSLLGWHIPHYIRLFEQLINSDARPTALVFGFVPWAREFLTDPRFQSLRVPEQISLATFEHGQALPAVPWCPPMTSIETNKRRTVQCIVETIGKMLAGEANPPSIRVPFDTTLTESIGPAPAP
jgi:DNA-binding LacI/PurR family transcriptional regulator/DNA-binding transcriptional regulator YhcF (GntR family)